ncbi:MAG TPA: hypothetical protein VGI30_08740 [Caulobacteraceae bacterium]
MAPGWSNFFFLIGSAAAGLIGLLFVIMTLMAGVERSKALRGQALYMTPTIAHFGAVFAISAVSLAPGLTLREAAFVFGFVALLGFACAGRAVIGFFRPSPGNEPHWSDFWLYAALPAVLYAALVVDAAGVWNHAAWAVRIQAGLLLILLLLGIRNAWDLVSWMAPSRPPPGNSEL